MRRFAYGFVAIAAAFAFTACSDDSSDTDGGGPGPDGGPNPDISLKEGGTGNEGSVPDGPQQSTCDGTKVGQPCNPTVQGDCGNDAICLPYSDTAGICTCECTPDDPMTPLVVEDNCPDQAYIQCGTVPMADGSDQGFCLRKCEPTLGSNPCTDPIGCNPESGINVGIFDSAVCLFPGCADDSECFVLSSEECSTDGSQACTDANAECLPLEQGGLAGLCVLPGKCDTASGNCAPREANFNANAAVGDPCQDDTECGAAMRCEREYDMAEDAVATGACTENLDCCSGRCEAGQCVPGTCTIHSRNGYCYQQYCSFASMPEYACPAGSVCNKFFSVGLCQKACTLDDPASCRGVDGDLNGDFECRSYNNFNQFFDTATGPTCDWGDMVDCTFFGIQDFDCSFVGLGADNTTEMTCRDVATGAVKTDLKDSTGFCLDTSTSGTTGAWQ